MARIAGVNLPKEKRVVIALTYILGIGNTTAEKLVKLANLPDSLRIKDLTDAQENALRTAIEGKLKVEGDLRRELLTNIKRLREIGSFRGSRHAKHLPVRGQRTKTNSRTVRGNVRRTTTSGKKLTGQKT